MTDDDERADVIRAVALAFEARSGPPPEVEVQAQLFTMGRRLSVERIHDYAIAEGLQTLEHSAMVEDEPTRKLSPVR